MWPAAQSLEEAFASTRLTSRYAQQFAAASLSNTGVIDVDFRTLLGSLPSDELTHGIFPYPARLLRQIPRFLLQSKAITEDVTFVVDPFCGSGTTLLESLTAGLDSYGIDQNPVATLISRVKTTPLNIPGRADELRHFFREANQTRARFVPAISVHKWFDPATLSILSRSAAVMHSRPPSPLSDIIALTLALFVRRTAQTDKRIPVPVRSKTPTPIGTWTLFESIATNLLERVSRLEKMPIQGKTANVILGDSRERSSWQTIPHMTSGLVLTSPPYGASQKYIRSTSLEAAWLGYIKETGTIALEHESVGREHLTRRDVQSAGLLLAQTPREDLRKASEINPLRGQIYASYVLDMERVAARIFESGVSKAIVISSTNVVAGVTIDTHDVLSDLMATAGFERKLILRDTIRGRSLMTTRRGGSKPASHEYVDYFVRKEQSS